MNQYYQQQQQQQYYYYQQQQQQYYQQQQQPQQSKLTHLISQPSHPKPSTKQTTTTTTHKLKFNLNLSNFHPNSFNTNSRTINIHIHLPPPPRLLHLSHRSSCPTIPTIPTPNNRHQQNHHQNQNDNSSNKRPKTHHNQLEKFRCEECRQDYYNLMDLSNHLRNHIKCDYQDCKFEAIQNILDLHREDRHLIFKPGREPKKANPKPDGPLNATIQGLGYALKTQEEIDNWIQERKKKWPTKAVITQKKAHAEEKKQKILSELSNKHKNEHKKPETGVGQERPARRSSKYR
ncbi:hypothetical protein PGT21_036620 [Puccinia graminis f. sp. tritici]|uniref:C2H2-type domain-containing protein n=1 Tax=Puccinia graminis f. sp. tritici TaxID=56615 RepID=A0A5B0QD89_PUCGR|nr:hypothetical protein PGT21_036620 [Puccinia graminis f. sp. tritici]